MKKFNKGDILIFDGKEINIKMQVGLKKGDKVEFVSYQLGGLILKKSNGYMFGIRDEIKKHFKIDNHE